MLNAVRTRTAKAAGEHFYYGWIIVAVAGIAMFSSGPGQSYTFSVFLDPIGADLGISKTTIASAYAIATLLAAFLLPRTGKLLDKYGPRKMLIVTGLLLGLACLFFGAAANFLWLAVGFALLRFMGQGATMMCTANLVSQWFSKKRGFAMSLMALGFAASMALHPPLASYLIEQYGWRWSWVILGALTWIIMLPPLFFLVFNRPESIGLEIDGEKVDPAKYSNTTVSGLTLSQAKQEPAFYLLCVVWLTVGGLVTVLHFFQVTVLTDRGFTSNNAAGLFTISAITMVITMPFIGKLFDKIRTRLVIAIALCMNALALLSITLVDSFSSAIFYAIVFGMTNAFMMTMFGYLWPRYFGRAHLGSIQGIGQMYGVLGASLAPLPVGYAIDTLSSSEGVLRSLAVFEIAIALLVVIFLRTPTGVSIPEGLE